MNKGWFFYYIHTFRRPKTTFDRFLEDKNNFRYGFLYILVPLVGYTAMYVFLTIGHGAPSVFTPWLNIPKEDYYSVNRFLLAPGLLISWFLSAAVIQVVGRAFKGKGTFEETLAVTGLCISVSMWGTLLHDLVMSFLSAMKIIDARQHEIAMNSPSIWRTILWICMAVYLAAFLLLFSKGVKAVHKITGLAPVLIGIFGFIVFQVMFVLFNR